jgi:hypothetical protein
VGTRSRRLGVKGRSFNSCQPDKVFILVGSHSCLRWRTSCSIRARRDGLRPNPGHALQGWHPACACVVSDEPPATRSKGLVLDWRRHSYRWSALVVTVRSEAGRRWVVQEWVDAERLRPVRSGPNRRQLRDH